MNKENGYILSNVSLVIVLLISNTIFLYENIISTLISLLSAFIIIRIRYNYNINFIKKIFEIITFAFICFEFICILYLIFNRFELSIIEVICFLIIVLKIILLNNEELRNFNQIFFYFVLIMISILIFSLYYTCNNFNLISINIKNFSFLLPLSMIITSSIVIDSFNITYREAEFGFIFGGILLIIIVILENFAFGENYIFYKHPIVSLSDLVPVSIVPFSEWVIMYLICIRESINIKYAYNYFKRLRRDI